MKQVRRRSCTGFGLLMAVAVMTGCTAGNGRLCGPQTPRAYCDKKTHDALANPPSQRDSWAAGTADASQLGAAWVACGGMANGNVGIDQQGGNGPETVQRLTRKNDDVQRCMMQKGYRYTGTCSGDIASRFPACQSR
ncbi:hypothetical protein [Stenotrophomonas rhizophila]